MLNNWTCAVKLNANNKMTKRFVLLFFILNCNNANKKNHKTYLKIRVLFLHFLPIKPF